MSSFAPKPVQMGIPSTMGDDVQLSLKTWFDRGAVVQPNSKVITKLDNGFHTTTYSQIKPASYKLASALSSVCGLKLGDICATFMWNTARHMMVYYAVPCMGAALLPLNLRLHPKELSYIIQHSRPKVVIIDAINLPLFEQIPRSALSSIKYFIICGNNMQSNNWKSTLPNTMDFEQLLSRGNMNYDFPNLNEKSGAFLFYTSGTTGNPKGVLYSHRSIVLAILTMMRMVFKGTDCVLALPPMFHVGGWFVTFVALTQGFKVLYPNNCYDFAALMNWSVDESANVMFGVPTMILGLAQAIKMNPKKFEPFRNKLRLLTGGTAIPGHVVNWLWKEWKIEISHGWAMTEGFPGTFSTRTYNRDHLTQTEEERTAHVLKQGTFDPLVEARLVNPENLGESVDKNGKDYGEILIRGPCVTSSYFKGVAPDNFIDGWLKTGDIAVISPRNEMQITDRSKDLIKSGGEWISSVDIENFVMELDEIELACVVGVYHPKWDERPIVVVQLHKGKTLSKEAILAHIATKYAKFQVPDDVLFWKEIPLTGTGKMSKRTVRDRLMKEKYKLPNSFIQSKM